MQLGVIVGLTFGVLIAFFAFVNRTTVIVNYFWPSGSQCSAANL